MLTPTPAEILEERKQAIDARIDDLRTFRNECGSKAWPLVDKAIDDLLIEKDNLTASEAAISDEEDARFADWLDEKRTQEDARY